MGRQPRSMPLTQIMETILAESAFQCIPSKQDHPVQALLFDRAHETLRVRIAVRRFGRNRDDVHVVFLQELLETPLCISNLGRW